MRQLGTPLLTNESDHGVERTVRAASSHGSANLFIYERKVPPPEVPGQIRGAKETTDFYEDLCG